MTESEFMASEDPAAMLDWIVETGGESSNRPRNPPSARKLRLFACALEPMLESGNYDDVTDWREELEVYMQPEIVLAVSDPAQQAALLRDIVGNPFRPVTIPWRCRECGIPCGPPAAGYYCVRCGSDEAMCPWLTPTVVSLARAAYDERGCRWQGRRHDQDEEVGWVDDGTLDNARLAVLSDALEEAGCPMQVSCTNVNHESLDEYGPSWGVFGPCSLCEGTRKVPHPILAHLRGPGPHVRGCHILDALLNLP